MPAAPSSDPPDGLDLLLAEREVRRRLLDYCRGVDTCDAALLQSVYHPDSTDDHGTFVGNGHDFVAAVVPVLRKRYVATQHTIGGTVFDWLDEHAVITETYVQAQHLGHDDNGQYLEWFAGVYLDRFEQRDGQWRIADRRLLRTWDKVERIEPGFEPGAFTDRHRA
ncbi:MAG: nuclear transport factor 2 family protein [Acidimicrobiales bacterium]